MPHLWFLGCLLENVLPGGGDGLGGGGVGGVVDDGFAGHEGAVYGGVKGDMTRYGGSMGGAKGFNVFGLLAIKVAFVYDDSCGDLEVVREFEDALEVVYAGDGGFGDDDYEVGAADGGDYGAAGAGGAIADNEVAGTLSSEAGGLVANHGDEAT